MNAIAMIHADVDAPMPLSAVGVTGDRYVFLLPGGGKCALTFIQLCDAAVLVALCGNNELWLRTYFPKDRRFFDKRFGASRWISTGINTVCAAHFLADLCIQAETKTIRDALRVTPRRPWWMQLRDWWGRRYQVVLASQP